MQYSLNHQKANYFCHGDAITRILNRSFLFIESTSF
jgi:hypothetical protein